VTGPIIIRKECTGDEPAIRTVLVSAFSRDAEADIVDQLRMSCPDALSLVAVVGNGLVGYVLFTPVTIEAAQRSIVGAGLAPLAVLPSLQKQGIGARLVTSGLDHLRRAGTPSVVVLGYPAYYCRFGFQPASRFRIACPFADVADEAFMILVLNEAPLHGVSGIARYRPEFSAAL
jgi:putative acetyltransferase